MTISAINWLAVLVAGVSAFVVGGIWYGPLFGKAWQQMNGISDEQIKASSQAKTFGGAFVLTLIASFGMAMLMQLHAAPGLSSGLGVGTVVGLAFVATSLGINYLFALKSMRLYLVDAGYLVLMFAVMGVIIGAWR